MEKGRVIQINGMVLEKEQLKKHLENIAITHDLQAYSDKSTYPIPRMLENFEIIKIIYNLLNENLKREITVHPAGEWLLDNFYIIEESVKTIKKELPLKKYKNFVGLKNGTYSGYSRLYVLATEIVSYTDNKIESHELEEYLRAYQSKKYLSMEEIWNIGIFLQIAIIENIRQICERIYSAEMQKIKATEIIDKYLQNEKKNQIKIPTIKKLNIDLKLNAIDNSKYAFVEYMSYCLKKYGKKSYIYMQALEEIVERAGMNISEAIEKEHFDVAVRKVSIGNAILSIKAIKRMNFTEIFEKINGVEELLKQDPSGIYEDMDYKTKEYYRNQIKNISIKTKISEIYIAKKILQLANEAKNNEKQKHIGYYLIDEGKANLYEALGYRYKKISEENKMKIYILSIAFFTIAVSCLINLSISKNINIVFNIFGIVFLLIPISEIIIQSVHYILGKIIKQKLIPKMDLKQGISKENSCIVVIPTIIKNKQKVKELAHKLEVFYLANKSENLYFAILGDCSQSSKQEEQFDIEVIKEGLNQIKLLNKKYSKQSINKFYFIYRKRRWNEKENSYLGWERKRGLLNQFNKFLLGEKQEDFRVNTFEKNSLPQIKYVITLDSDTDLPLGTAKELIGAMSHILNKPIIDPKKNIVVKGYGIMQPRVGINLDISYKNLFTKIFAGQGGTDLYANAISDVYQDNFKEGIFTGKGIYDLKVFEQVVGNSIPENTVLSHDLLEGCYLRCGLVSDILLMDEYPSKYMSYINRQSRWIRGDWQIIKWLKNKKINIISKYKIFDNLRRSLLEISVMICLIYFNKVKAVSFIALFSIIMPNILEFLNYIMFKKEGEKYQKSFVSKVGIIQGTIYRSVISIGTLPYKAYISGVSILKAIYRMTISHKNLLEWTTSEEAEKISKTDILSYYKLMIINVILGILILASYFIKKSIIKLILGILWIIIPSIMFYISKIKNKKRKVEELDNDEKEYITDIAKRTWDYFSNYLVPENNYLIPDNYQEGRIPVIANRTSSTNIGLSLLAVISSSDLGFINKVQTIKLLEKIINVIINLPKWNGHLYNWYNIKTKNPLLPRYVSTVDSGNYVGYLYVTLGYCNNNLKMYSNLKLNNKKYKLHGKKVPKEFNLKQIITSLKIMKFNLEQLIKNTDFSILYSKEQRLFSIGFNIEENKLTNSYYDLLASEARQASLVAIAKKDIPAKHWSSLSRTLTTLNEYKGLISWSGTAFEYLMPNINIPVYEGSLIDESCRFMIMSQKEYAKILGIPWGISEAAFNLKDLQLNYQYKAFGIPWLGLKRGLADEMVVSSYGSILAINYIPKEVIKNLKELEKQGMYSKYGFYESIDYTPERLNKGEKSNVVKTYMAHHQALILLSINNLINDNILQKRFIKNPEIEGVKILLQERMPETFITTKDMKEKVEKIKYKDYEGYTEQVLSKVDERIIRGNVISNENYTVAINQKGRGFSKFGEIYINRYKKTSDEVQGIFFFVKDIKTNKIWSTNYNKQKKYTISFMPDKIKQEIIVDGIKTLQKITVVPNDPVEIRKLEITNNTNEEKILEIVSYFEPILSSKEQDYAHQAFNNLFLIVKYDEESGTLIVKRKNRRKDEKNIYLSAKMSTDAEQIGETEYEIDKERFVGRGNLSFPNMIKQSIPFTKKLGLVTEPILAMKTIIKVKPEQTVNVNLIISVEYDKQTALLNLEKYNMGDIERIFEISKVRCEAQSRYLRIKGQDIETYQKIISYILFDNPLKSKWAKNLPKQKYSQKDLWKYGISGDLPIIALKVREVNDVYSVKQILKAYEFIKIKNIMVDLVILNQEKYSYENYVREEIEKEIANMNMSYLKNIKGGIFVLSESEMNQKDVNLIEFIADLVIDGHLGGIKTVINDMEEDEFGGK